MSGGLGGRGKGGVVKLNADFGLALIVGIFTRPLLLENFNISHNHLATTPEKISILNYVYA